MIFVIMGVSGSGKTTIGKLLAEQWDIPFYDADDFHPESNKYKMAQGKPLTDQDRWPWLEILANKIRHWNDKGDAVLACSALKKVYRRKLAVLPENQMQWVFLNGAPDLISKRLSVRRGHFFDPKLLQSQFDTLEIPENALEVDIADPPEVILDRIERVIKP